MLETVALTYGDHLALDGLNLKVEPGEVFCLLGANGAGKTTTIHLFLGFLEASSGRALVDGLDVAREPFETKQRLAYVPEGLHRLTVDSFFGCALQQPKANDRTLFVALGD
ncbi:MAG: ATP-binding cassette domain-containing protein [Thermoanaerobaculia bacterium]|nr:ATP-binding cassette domain-containing protein [Thermoanaerobaculia bacterium]